MIDTGSNKSFLSPNRVHLQNCESIDKVSITNVRGKFIVDKCASFNPFPNSKFSYKEKFLIFDANSFFDGVIGLQFLQKIKAVIDCNKMKLDLPDISYNLKRKFPDSIRIHLKPTEQKLIKVKVSNNGDFLIPKDIYITPTICINKGIYNATKNHAFLSFSNNSTNTCSFVMSTNNSVLKNADINNFDTIDQNKYLADMQEVNKQIFSRVNIQNLNIQERTELYKIIIKHKKCFHNDSDKLTCTSAVTHAIHTVDQVPVFQKSYKYPYVYKDEVKRQISKLLDQGIIQHSSSPWSAPIWIVPKKKDNSGINKVRIVCDYRKLNEKTISDKYPIPDITDILDKLGKCQYFSVLDLAQGFHQVKIRKEDVPKTAFAVENGKYEWKRMPFGLKNAPATFQRVLDDILRDLIGKSCLIFMDDIICFGTSLQESIQNLDKVLQKLSEYNLKVQIDKCAFLQKEVEFLGHVVTRDGIKPNPNKIKAIKDWPIPKNQKELRGFLGIMGYYRRFIRDFAKIVKPLTIQLKKDQQITHTPDFVDTINKCKNILSSSDILSYPDFSQNFILTTDASNYCLGAVLSQKIKNVERPIAFASRTLQKNEINYSTTEKEMLAIIWATKYFRPYLYGRRFLLITDHQPLIYLNSNPQNAKLIRWRLVLNDFEFDIEYKKGVQNVVADSLSRINHAEINLNMSMENNAPSEIDTIHSADTSDDFYISSTELPINNFPNQIILKIGPQNFKSDQIFQNAIRHTIQEPKFTDKNIPEILRKTLDYRKTNAILCPTDVIQTIQETYKQYFAQNKKLRLQISHKLVQDIYSDLEQTKIIEDTHLRAHRGIEENFKVISQKYFFPNLKNKIKTFISMCKTCKQAKYDRKPYNLAIEKTPIPTRPFQILHIDVYFANKQIFLSCVDKFSRYGILIPLKSRSTPDIKKALIKIFTSYPQPQLLVSDNESALKSIEIRGFLESLKIDTYYTPSNRSEMNGIVERFHSTIAEIYRCMKSKHPKLVTKSLLKICVSLYNNTIHSATKFTPNEIIFSSNVEKNLPINIEEIMEKKDKLYDQVIINLINKQKSDTKLHNKNTENNPNFQKDEIIYVDRKGIKNKTKNKFEPMTVKENNNKTVTVNDGRKIHKANIRRK